MQAITVGIDIGTHTIKALALNSEGGVAAKVQRKSSLSSPGRYMLEHDAEDSWRQGILEVWEEISQRLREQNISDAGIHGICVAAMIPSLSAVDSNHKPISPGILYGDQRGGSSSGPPTQNTEFLNFLKWTTENYPSAAAYWPAQTVANAALGSAPMLDNITAITTGPLFSDGGWDEGVCQELRISPTQLPTIANPTDIVGEVNGIPLLAGTIDALAELIVLEPQELGDVVAIFGSTLICWVIADSQTQAQQTQAQHAQTENQAENESGLWTLGHADEDKALVGGPSNAGGLFVDKVRHFFGFEDDQVENQVNRAMLSSPENLPIWLPYIRGEYTPLHNPNLTASLHGLDLSHSNAEILRAAHEASAFVIRRHIELTKYPARRILATGGGTKSLSWMEAVADVTGLPVEITEIPEGGALGAAWIARCAQNASLDFQKAAGLNRVIKRIEPDHIWQNTANERYQKFLELH